MRIENLIEFQNKKVKATLRNNRILTGILLIQNNIVIIKDSKKHGVLIIPQEITQLELLDTEDENNAQR